MDSKDIKIVNYIMQNCEMGISSLKKLREMLESNDMQQELSEELQNYKGIYDKASKINENLHGERTPICMMQKFMAKMGIKMNVMMDKSDSHIAEMLIQGTNMGIIELNKILNANPDYSNEEILSILKELLQFEENRINKLKAYL